MKKPIIIVLLLVLILSLAACGKEEEDLSWLNQYEHQVATPVPVTATPTPEATPTPYDTMQSYHKDGNIVEVRVQISIGMVYDKPYQGEAVGYLLNEDFTTEDLLWADHNNMVGFKIGQMSLYGTKDDHIYEIIQELDPDTIVWIYDHDVLLSLVPHPEDYDMLDWGE